jgi:hypothetical protein
MITKETATDIALAYREIETAETKALSQREMPDIRDAFGRPQGGLQLGVPSGIGSHRLFNVQWSLAKPILQAHIADHQAKIVALNEKAKSEAEGASP